jgi:enoyl-[acyl-carrier protein] reductase II
MSPSPSFEKSPQSRESGAETPVAHSPESRRILEDMWLPARRFLGCDYGIIGGAMSWVSEHTLVAAISDAGAFGVYAASAMSPDQLRDGILATRALTDRPFGVNVITFHPQFEDMVDLCIETAVSHVVIGGGLPSTDTVDRLKQAEIGVICFAATMPMAKRALRLGAGALVIEGMEAGGHVGPVSTSVLSQEILPQVQDVPVFVAGGIARGEAIAGYMVMGAAGCQIGTRLACAVESQAHPKFKQAFFRAKARQAVVTQQLDSMFRVVPVRAIANQAMDKFTTLQRELMGLVTQGKINSSEAQGSVEEYWSGRLKRAVVDGDIENGSLMAGQCVSMVSREQSVAEIISELVDQAVTAIDRLPGVRDRACAIDEHEIRRQLGVQG